MVPPSCAGVYKRSCEQINWKAEPEWKYFTVFELFIDEWRCSTAATRESPPVRTERPPRHEASDEVESRVGEWERAREPGASHQLRIAFLIAMLGMRRGEAEAEVERLRAWGGMEVTTVNSPRRALDLLGLESSELKEIPVVIMSSENVPSRINMCLKEGANDFLIKPVQPSDVSKLRSRMMRR
ncbi:Two-component response regulator ORR5 [Ananas comosus]|uniref:Two-component response regulator ORR5 n=1 Tax=Ananas comosus TaxID=4615 RepID=A0A199VDU3_ANACO|nr:Two-component response regulator ORR5 [Ananas comosus]